LSEPNTLIEPGFGMSPAKPPMERFAALEAIPGVRHGFVIRAPNLDVRTERAEALRRLQGFHEGARETFGARHFREAAQVHGNVVTRVSAHSSRRTEGADGLITDDSGVLLGIYVADCCAIFLVDPMRRAIGLVHSGRKGSELNIVGEAVRQMEVEFGTSPRDIVAQLSPCIRPPFYEVDFAATIRRQLEQLNVGQIHDSGANTGAEPLKYYSYRMEKGQTGRMLGLLAIGSP
jgi:copper oxidase (laccase) domain-containing protein